MNIQWYPGHMTKTRRRMEEDLKLVDAVCELLDARIPYSSRNPDIDRICAGKPRLIVLNRIDQADPSMTKKWSVYFQDHGYSVLETDCKARSGVDAFPRAVRALLGDKIKRDTEKGLVGKSVKAMVVGVPNVGKSTFINQVAKRKSAKAENRPGVTRGKQWIRVDPALELLDTPGILWPRFEDQRVGRMLAYTGAVKDNVVDLEDLACHLMELLAQRYPQRVSERYKIEIPETADGFELLEAAGRKRGFLVSGGETDIERISRVILDEYRNGKLGRITFESPEDFTKEQQE